METERCFSGYTHAFVADQPVDGLMRGRFAFTVAGMALLYRTGLLQDDLHPGGATEYQVVAPPPARACPRARRRPPTARPSVDGGAHPDV